MRNKMQGHTLAGLPPGVALLSLPLPIRRDWHIVHMPRHPIPLFGEALTEP
jgi:hypothetical protein